MRKTREVIAVRGDEVRRFESVSEAAKHFRITAHAVHQALDCGCLCMDYRLYDTPEKYDKRIDDLERRKKEVEALL